LLAFEDGELLAKSEVFEHQTAARPTPAKHGSEPEAKQVKRGNQVIADRLCDRPAKLSISQPDRIVTRHSYAKLARKHIARTGSTAREMWKLMQPCNEANAMFAYSSHG